MLARRGLKHMDEVGNGGITHYYDNGCLKDAYKNSWESH